MGAFEAFVSDWHKEYSADGLRGDEVWNVSPSKVKQQKSDTFKGNNHTIPPHIKKQIKKQTTL